MAPTVLTLVRLRFQVLANSLRRSPAQLVAVILGALQVLGMGGFALLTGWLQGFNEVVIERHAPQVIVGAIITLAWVLAPLVIGGAEPALDPRKLARYPVSAGRLLRADLIVGLAWFPALATFVTGLALALTWRDRPLAALGTILSAVLITLTCVIASRTATTAATDLVARRGAAGRVLATLIAGAVLLAPVVVVLLLNWPPWERFPELLRALSFTPIGAAWAIPGYLAEPATIPIAIACLAVALATIGLLLLAWRAVLARALATRPTTGRRRTSRLGILGVVPTGATGAILGRSLVLWFRDPRLVIQLAILPVVPLLFVLLAVFDRVDWFAYVAGPVAAGLLPLTQFAGISYDGTAFASEIAAAVRGLPDRIGRAAAMLMIALPVVLAAAIVAPILVGSPERVPAVAGLTVAALLAATGVASVSSAFIAVPVPASGKNPFSSPPGSNTIQVFGSYVVTAITVVVLAPVIALGTIALVTAAPALGWWTLGVGTVWGAGTLVAGILVGAGIFDRQAPALLARVRTGRMR